MSTPLVKLRYAPPLSATPTVVPAQSGVAQNVAEEGISVEIRVGFRAIMTSVMSAVKIKIMDFKIPLIERAIRKSMDKTMPNCRLVWVIQGVRKEEQGIRKEEEGLWFRVAVRGKTRIMVLGEFYPYQHSTG